MPTAKPRVQVTLTSSSYATISRLARARQVSRSLVIAELLDAATPALDRTAELIEVARAAPKHVLQRFAGALDVAEDSGTTAFTSQLGQLDLLVHGLREGKPWTAGGDGEGSRAQRGSPPARGKAPGPVTRGPGRGATVTPTRKKHPKKAVKSAIKRGKTR